jgi:uncharacterized protein YegJ (DUF2314 family)
MNSIRTLMVSQAIVACLAMPDVVMACEKVDPCKASDDSYGELIVAGCLLLAWAALELFQRMRSRFPAVSPIDPEDPRLARATFKALASIQEFWTHYADPADDEVDFALKITLPTEDGNEHIWVGDISERNGQLFGRLANEPVSDQYELGQTIRFDRDQITDWTYEKAGSLRGNFSFAVIVSELPEKRQGQALDALGWTEDDLFARLS